MVIPDNLPVEVKLSGRRLEGKPPYRRWYKLFSFLFKEVGAHAAEGALVIFGELFALVDIAANRADKLLHISFLHHSLIYISFWNIHRRVR